MMDGPSDGPDSPLPGQSVTHLCSLRIGTDWGLGLGLRLVGVKLEYINFLLFLCSSYLPNFRLIRAIIKKPV